MDLGEVGALGGIFFFFKELGFGVDWKFKRKSLRQVLGIDVVSWNLGQRLVLIWVMLAALACGLNCNFLK